MINRNPLLIIAGPTAVGKTDLSIRLAKHLGGEIISADSMQVYKNLNIGTAKPDLAQQQKVKHHLIDIVEPDQDFSVADYQNAFNKVAPQIIADGKLPIVVGGTGLYIRACTQEFFFEPQGADWEYRQQLQDEADRYGLGYLHQKLFELDPERASAIHSNDVRRVIRALEIIKSTGEPVSQLPKTKSQNLYQLIYLFLDRNRHELYCRIDQRVDEMIKLGLIEEVQNLRTKGYSLELKPLQSLGYHEIGDYLEGKNSLEEAIKLIKQHTRNYAKRQLTWFRREPVDWWLNISEKQEYFGEILEYVEGRLRKMSNRL